MRLSACVAFLVAAGGLCGSTGCESKKQAEPGSERAGASSTAETQAEAPPGPVPPVETRGPEVELVNGDYDRLRSRVLIRRIRRATKANLEFAVHDSNIMTYDPKQYAPKAPEGKPKLATLDFDGALVKDSLCDRISDTPLTDAEKNSPMAWAGLSEHLINWDFEKALAFAELGAKISDEKWNDNDVPIAYQEITRVYLHAAPSGEVGAGGTGTEVWVRVEFKPWVKFLVDLDDEDGDGFGEIYGRIPQQAVTADILEEIEKNYRGVVLSPEEVADWVYELGSAWYPRYNTETLKDEKFAAWPDEKVKAEYGTELAALGGERPSFVIEGRPFEKTLYNILFIEGLQKEGLRKNEKK